MKIDSKRLLVYVAKAVKCEALSVGERELLIEFEAKLKRLHVRAPQQLQREQARTARSVKQDRNATIRRMQAGIAKLLKQKRDYPEINEPGFNDAEYTRICAAWFDAEAELRRFAPETDPETARQLTYSDVR